MWRSSWTLPAQQPPDASTPQLPLAPARSAPELQLGVVGADDAGITGDTSCRSMKSTGSGGAQFELMLLRKECEDLRRQLDASSRREQGLAAQVRAQHVLRQSRDNKARQAVTVAPASETRVQLRPDSSFLEPLLQEGTDAACVEMLMTAFTYDDPRITDCAIVARSRGAIVRLLILTNKRRRRARSRAASLRRWWTPMWRCVPSSRPGPSLIGRVQLRFQRVPWRATRQNGSRPVPCTEGGRVRSGHPLCGVP